MTYIRPLLVLAAFSLGGCGNAGQSDAQAAQPATEVLAAATTAPISANWEIIAADSHIRFSALQEGEPFEGAFTEFTGEIDFDPDAPETGAVRITIPLASVEAGSKDRNSTLPSKVWFSTKAFPTAVFEARDISKAGEGYLAKGTLSLKGTSVPLSIPLDLDMIGDTAVMSGKMAIDRTLWGVGEDPWNTDEWVSREVTLDIQIAANRK